MVCCVVRETSSAAVPGALEAVARSCSPRVVSCGDAAAIFDASGLARVLGSPREIGMEVAALAQSRGVSVQVALSETLTSAWILAHACRGVTVVDPGREASALADLPLVWLSVLADLDPFRSSSERPSRGRRPRRPPTRHFRVAPAPPVMSAPEADAVATPATGAFPFEVLALFDRWGLRVFGDLAKMPRADLHARLGAVGVRLHQASCGEDSDPLVPADERVRFRERRELEWPIEGLEPLSFVLSGACEALAASLERADRGAVAVTTTLHLVAREAHVRTLQLPAPMRDARVLRTLIVLDLESHPPGAGIDVVDIDVDVAPGRITQGSLLARSLPSPEDLATLLARLGALMGERRVGAPLVVDSHDDREFGLAPFNPAVDSRQAGAPAAAPAAAVPWTPPGTTGGFRRFRLPIAARVVVERGAPVRVLPAARGLPGGVVTASAGPWRTSGHWWALEAGGWDRDEWDVEIARSGLYRLTRDRATGRWEIEGMAD